MIYKIIILLFIVNFIILWVINILKKQKEVETQEVYSSQESKPFRLYLLDCGPEKIKVIKLLRECNNSLDLTAAKDLIENTPAIITEVDTQNEAEQVKQQFQILGARVEVQSVQRLQ